MAGAGVTAPIIVSALFGAEDAARLDALRRRHFPPERNHLAAHLTLFHHLPPSAEAELRRRLAEEARASRPDAALDGAMNLGRGTAIRVASPALAAVRARLADAFVDLLTPQDRAGWRPHVTIQNKVTGEAAAALREALPEAETRRPLVIAALAMWWYRDGPWEAIARYPFRG